MKNPWQFDMKRYRIIVFDFDTRVFTLDKIQDDWDEQVKQSHRDNQDRLISELKAEYGERDFEIKLANFKELGAKPFSVLAFHNRFLAQSRRAFVHGQYYPALTAISALGERILNHLVIGLRNEYKSHPRYKHIYRKNSFDDWTLPIDVLFEWGIFSPEVAASFRALKEKRNYALHFNLSTELNDRKLAFEAIKNLEEIVSCQFSATGNLPWLLFSPGECYIKKEYEHLPFIKLVYLPNCVYLSYKHTTIRALPWEFKDDENYANQDISDEKFVHLRREFRGD
jgi:hypothetical protein